MNDDYGIVVKPAWDDLRNLLFNFISWTSCGFGLLKPKTKSSSGVQIMIKDGRSACCYQECAFIYSMKVKSGKYL